MTQNELPPLNDFPKIKSLLETERKALLKVHAFSADEEIVRPVEQALIVLDTIESIHTQLDACFQQYPSLLSLFNQDFGSYIEFCTREVILERCLLDDCLFPAKDTFYFVETPGGKISEEILKSYEASFAEWCLKVTKDHLENLEFLKSAFNTDVKLKETKCVCISCSSEYRNRLREAIYEECVELIDKVKAQIERTLEEEGKLDIDFFRSLQKNLDKKFFKFRFRLKRSSLNKLETQVKNKVKDLFAFPAALAKRQVEGNVLPLFKDILKSLGLRQDLVEDETYERFFSQLSTNIWRGENYLEAEFKKLLKSIMALKRKDISANILKTYLGEFWIHSPARRINRKIIYHAGPTNSGKTYHAIEALSKASKGCYLAPLRLLAGELYDTLNEKGVATTLLTGEEVIEVEGSTHYSSTIEMARFHEEFDCCVIDEIQMITDSQRGWAWTRALVNIHAEEVHICGDPSVLDLVRTITDLCGDQLEVKYYERMTKLEVETSPITVGGLAKSDALIVFSRRNALRFKSDLERCGFKVSIVYGRLSPEVRREQARKFDSQETDIIVSTDAIAMGMNLPIKRIVFSTLTKHIDAKAFDITDSEIKQIAGRAGRYLRFPVGNVTCLSKVENGLVRIQKALNMELVQKTKCMVGPDLDIFSQVNNALKVNSLPELKLSEFLRLFNTMTFKKPFFCVDLKEMIELAEMVEEADFSNVLSISEIFGFACAPVNLGLMEHVQYYVWILNNYVRADGILSEPIDYRSGDIDYLETSIKCVELYQWLARHFNNKNFEFSEWDLLDNKSRAIERLNELLSDTIARTCASCGKGLQDNFDFAICDECFKQRRFVRRRPPRPRLNAQQGQKSNGGGSGGKKKNFSRKKPGTTFAKQRNLSKTKRK